MAKSPQWKVYDSAGNYQASCKEIEAAAALVSFYANDYSDSPNERATIRHGHSRIVWTEGVDGTAADSYDNVAEVVYGRVYAK